MFLLFILISKISHYRPALPVSQNVKRRELCITHAL